jgi:pyruvate dehydrogenase complex dehydrogenase (E1) component
LWGFKKKKYQLKTLFYPHPFLISPFFFFFFFFLGRCEALQRTLGEWRKEKKGKGIDSQPSTRYHFEDDDFF